MSKSSEKNQILTENNERSQVKKRRRSLSPDSLDDLSPKASKTSKRWKGSSSSQFQSELLEEMGVSMLPEALEEDKAVENFISSSSDSEYIDSALTNRESKKKRREPFKFLGAKLNQIDIGSVCLNNNQPPPGSTVAVPAEKGGKVDGSAGKAAADECKAKESVTELDASAGQKSDCFCTETNGMEDSAAKENSKSLKWEKLKPVNCKIRNSKIIYQSDVTLIESDGPKSSERVERSGKSRVDKARRSKGERKVKDEDDSDFFIYRKPGVDVIVGEDHFNDLSDEVILSIFKWLPKKSLVSCALVCKRFVRLAYDEALWARMDLGGRKLSPKAVGYIVSRGIRILRLAQAGLPDPVYCPQTTALSEDFVSKLQYLDLSMASISAAGLSTFLNFCRHLKKLSLENCHLSQGSAEAIARNAELEVLNLTMCIGLTSAAIGTILKNCRRLQSLNISWTGLSASALSLIACKVPSTLERLNISGCRQNLTNEHVIEIFHRCENLIELDVSDSIELTDQVINFIVKYVKKIEYLSFSRCYSINTSSFALLKHVDSLMFLDIFGLMKEEELNELKNEFTDVAINQFPFSSVARPTVGLRRTSIWGLRVRD